MSKNQIARRWGAAGAATLACFAALSVAGSASAQTIDGCVIAPNTNCPGLDMSFANLTGANMPASNLFMTNLTQATLVDANFTQAILARAILTGANAQRVIFARTNLRRADLRDADLRNANLRRADFLNADLTGAKLDGASFCFTTMPDGSTKSDASGCGPNLAGTAGRDTMLGGREADRFSGGAGSDVLIGGAGNDKLLGGPGHDVLVGGAGRDTLNGGPGPDTLIDTSGPTLVRTGTSASGRDLVDVRDGRGDDTVICASRHSTVVADAGDHVGSKCGEVIRG